MSLFLLQCLPVFHTEPVAAQSAEPEPSSHCCASRPSGIASLCTVAVISVERYVVVCNPVGGVQFQTRYQGLGGERWFWFCPQSRM